MKVICNTTPFIALSSIDQIPLLKELYGSIQVPQAVIAELKAGGNIPVPDITNFEWIRVVPDITDISNRLLFQLDNGERQVILNALKILAEPVIIDDRVARNIAEYLGLKIKGTLGILAEAKKRGLIASFKELAKQMREKGIYYSPRLIKEIVKNLKEA